MKDAHMRLETGNQQSAALGRHNGLSNPLILKTAELHLVENGRPAHLLRELGKKSSKLFRMVSREDHRNLENPSDVEESSGILSDPRAIVAGIQHHRLYVNEQQEAVIVLEKFAVGIGHAKSFRWG
jgi:hypothetical protein